MNEDRMNSKANLEDLYKNMPENLDHLLPGQRRGKHYLLKAFGEICRIRPEGIDIGMQTGTGEIRRLITLYALHAQEDPCRPTPFKAFRELANSMPFVSEFSTNAEQILIPHMIHVEKNLELIFKALDGELGPGIEGEDLSIIVRPLPKIKLCYNFYLADDELPASVTCLFSNNALSFLPIGALAKIGACTSRKMIELISP